MGKHTILLRLVDLSLCASLGHCEGALVAGVYRMAVDGDGVDIDGRDGVMLMVDGVLA